MIRVLAFSPESQFLASAGRDQTIRLWDLKTGQQISLLRGHVLELARGRVPLPALRQGLRHAPSTPLGILFNQPTNLGDLGAADSATLNRFGFLHAPTLPDEGVRIPSYRKIFSLLFSPALRLHFDLSSFDATKSIAGAGKERRGD